MAQITLKGNPINTSGELPAVGTKGANFNLVRNDLSEATLETYAGKVKVLNIFPSLDTGTCAMSVRQFNERAAAFGDAVVLCISKDLPFAQKRFCGAEGIEKVETLSDYRSDFSKQYGLEILDGPLKGLCSRSVVILDADNNVIYTQQVTETVDEPDYEAALKALS